MFNEYILICFAVLGAAYSNPQCGSTLIRKLYTPIEVTRVFTSPIVRLVNPDIMDNQLDSAGPDTPPLPIVQAPSVTLPIIEEPIVALPSPPIPAPRVLSQRCICTKTVVKPQIIQRSVTVPKIERYLKRTYTPVIEQIAYKSRPKPCCKRCKCRKMTCGSNFGTFSSKTC